MGVGEPLLNIKLLDEVFQNEDFIKEILIEDYSSNYKSLYDNSLLLQYLDKKMGAVHGSRAFRFP